MRWAKKSFPDGSTIRTATRESWLYTDPGGRSVEVIVDYAGKEVEPSNVVQRYSLSAWNSSDPISDAERRDVLQKLELYFGAGTIRVDR